MQYQPNPIDTSKVQLTPTILELTELLARHTHDIWGQRRIQDGWKYGPTRDDAKKEHPCLVPYDELPESEKKYDRDTAIETLKAIVALGYEITRAPTHQRS